MPGRNSVNVDWTLWDDHLKRLEAQQPQPSLQAIYDELKKLGYTNARSTLMNRRYALGLWRRPAYDGHERLPPDVKHVPRRLGPRHFVGELVDRCVPRACVRPPVRPHVSLTGWLLGDPPPGRTPWA